MVTVEAAQPLSDLPSLANSTFAGTSTTDSSMAASPRSSHSPADDIKVQGGEDGEAEAAIEELKEEIKEDGSSDPEVSDVVIILSTRRG